ATVQKTTQGGTQIALSKVGRAVSAAASSIGSAGANKVITGHSGFSWANVASAAVTASLGGRLPGETITGLNLIDDFVGGVGRSAVGYGVNRAFGGDRSWNGGNVALDAFGNALGNSIVSGLSKPPKLTNADKAKLDAFSQAATDISKAQSDKTGAMTDARIAEIAQQTGSQAEAAAMQKVEALNTVKDVNTTFRDVSGINALTAKYKTDLASLTQRHNEQMYSVQMTLANDQWLFGNTRSGTEVTLIDPPVTPPPVTPRSQEPSLLSRYIDYSNQQPVTPIGAIQLLPAWGAMAYDLNAARTQGLGMFANKGADFFNLGKNMVVLDGSQRPGVNPNQVPRSATNIGKALLETGVVTDALKGGGAIGAKLGPIGTTIEYAFNDDKHFLSTDFAIDAGVDTAKGWTSGVVGGAATTAVIGLATIAGVTIGAPVVAAGVAAGFLTGYFFGENVFDEYGGDQLRNYLKD
ncbi:MAG: hypothetical protein HRT38_19050, partial [Alteromonadaceae bacterium]|nr:hypothetical protein [Alteromonadaceae bacterium]